MKQQQRPWKSCYLNLQKETSQACVFGLIVSSSDTTGLLLFITSTLHISFVSGPKGTARTNLERKEDVLREPFTTTPHSFFPTKLQLHLSHNVVLKRCHLFAFHQFPHLLSPSYILFLFFLVARQLNRGPALRVPFHGWYPSGIIKVDQDNWFLIWVCLTGIIVKYSLYMWVMLQTKEVTPSKYIGTREKLTSTM
jgi:hypothetical protein